MTQPDDIAARLPSPRDDEPRELRRDIVDELADHLHCAVARERLRDEGVSGGSDAANRDEVAINVALERFGDPAGVARRLWFDAMKEKIMTQRAKLLIAAGGGALVALLLVFMGQMIFRFQALQVALADVQRQLAEKKEPETKTPSEPKEVPVEKFPLSVKLVDEQGKPVQGDVGVIARTNSPNRQPRRTASDGIVDFGTLPAGHYTLNVQLDSGESTSCELWLAKNQAVPIEIVRPGKMVPVPFRFAISVPESMTSEPLYYLAQIERVGVEFDGRPWMTKTTKAALVYLLDEKGNVLGEASPVDVVAAMHLVYGGGQFGPQAGGFGGVGGARPEVPEFVDHIPTDLVLHKATDVLPGNYNLALAAYRPTLKPAADGVRPPLQRLALNVMLQVNFDIGADGQSVCKIGHSEQSEVDFWRGVRSAIADQRERDREQAPNPGNPNPFQQDPNRPSAGVAPAGRFGRE